MQKTQIPPLISLPFANNGDKNTIPTASSSPAASFYDGFPVATETPIDEGGVPPDRRDFNGIFNSLSALNWWQNAGGMFPFNTSLSTSIGGYPKGAVVLSNDQASAWVSLIDNNTNDPNTPANVGPYWAPYAGACATDGFYGVATGTADAIVVAQNPPITVYANGHMVRFKAIATNTGATTINAGGGAIALRNKDGSALNAGVIIGGLVYDAVYDSVDGYFRLFDAQYATNSEAQAFTNNSHAITPYTLNNALKGANQSLVASGYQKLPGGVILQWGTVAMVEDTWTTYSFPMAFPNECLVITGNAIGGLNAGNQNGFVKSISASQYQVSGNDVSYGTGNLSWIAIGR